nr:granulocyte colony-stimulating factor isoform X2 [Macaca fascicularis]
MAIPAAQSPMKLMALQLLLWHSALWTVQEATPLGPASSLPQSFLLKCLEQVRKIQGDGAALQEKLTGCLSQLHSSLFLYQGLLQALEGISPELSPTLDTLQLDIADFATTIWQQVSLVGQGCQGHAGILGTAAGPVAPSISSFVITPTQQGPATDRSFPLQMEDLGMAPALQPTQGAMPAFTSAFQRRAGGVLVASHLQRFLELAYRVLRHLAQS